MTQPFDVLPKITVEACVGSFDGARDAELAGADRIELNSALELDGLTPPAGLLELVSSSVNLPIIAMARPRAGDFCYSNSEWKTLLADARWLLAHGADGLAFGCLDKNREVDRARCDEMRNLAGSSQLVFHKAFDDVVDWRPGLEMLISTGIDRVMTSGQHPTAESGLGTITEITAQAAGRIGVLPAGGINSKNAVKIVNQSGASQIHGSFSGGPNAHSRVEIRETIELLDNRSNAH